MLRKTVLHAHIGSNDGVVAFSMSGIVPTVYIVDDDISVRESLEELVRQEGWQPETFVSAESFLLHPKTTAPSCLILDVNLPELSGLDLQKRVALDEVEIPIIFITGYGDIPMTVQAMKAGAVEFLTKPVDGDALLNAVSQAIERNRSALYDELEMRTLRDCYATLSRREQEVMALVVHGLMNKQIGCELGISVITVKAHRYRMMRKMRANTVADLVNMNVRLNLKPRAESAILSRRSD